MSAHVPDPSASPKGIQKWTTSTGVRTIRLHYSAFPKRDPDTPQGAAWLQKALEGYIGGKDNPAWKMEQEIDFSIRSGVPIYKIFREEHHVAKSPLIPIPHTPILRGWDYGLTPACAIAQLTRRPHLNIFPCVFTAQNESIGIKRFSEKVLQYCNMTFPGFTFIDYGDPAGGQRAQTDERTCFEIQRDFKDDQGRSLIQVEAGEVTWTGRHRAMEDVLRRIEDDGLPFLQVDPRERFLIDAFKGGYRKKQVANKEIYLDEPEKNEYSHLMNALEYLVSRLQYGRPAPPPRRGSDDGIASTYNG
jgi:hypothetical protein